MTGQKIAELSKEDNAELGKIKPAKSQGQAATPMIDKEDAKRIEERLRCLTRIKRNICEGMQKRF
jgi:hypothetical protein